MIWLRLSLERSRHDNTGFRKCCSKESTSGSKSEIHFNLARIICPHFPRFLLFRPPCLFHYLPLVLQRWTSNLEPSVGSCCVCLYVAKTLHGFTFRNVSQQHATTCTRVCKGPQHVSNIQQRWDVGQQCCTGGLNPIRKGGFWGFLSLKNWMNSKPFKLGPLNLGTFPKIHLENFKVFVTCTSTLMLPCQPSFDFWQPCFGKFAFSLKNRLYFSDWIIKLHLI